MKINVLCNLMQLAAVTAGIGMPCLSVAEPGPDPALAECRAIEAPETRLRCYDRVAGRVEPGAGASTGPANAEPAPIPEAVRNAPAVAAPTVQSAPPPTADELFGQDDETLRKAVEQATGVKVADEISATVRAAAYNGRGRLVIRLDNGQLWDQVSSGRFPLEAGDTVVIRRAVLGSYALRKSGGKRSIKVRRRSADTERP